MEGVELCSRKTQFLTGLNDHFAIGELRRKGIILECGIVDGDLVRILIFLGGECDRREILDAPGKNIGFGYVPRAEQEIIGALFRLYKRNDHRIAFFRCKLRAPFTSTRLDALFDVKLTLAPSSLFENENALFGFSVSFTS